MRISGTLAIFLGSAEQRVQLGKSNQKLEQKTVNGGEKLISSLTNPDGFILSIFLNFGRSRNTS